MTRARRRLRWWQETVVILAVAVLLAVVLKAFFVEAFYIPSPSMQPLLVKDDKILVQKVSYWGSGTPQRGDVVVFEDPGDWLLPSEKPGPSGPVRSVLGRIGLLPTGGHLVKRVVGIAGDTITCCDDDGRIEVNGQPVGEDDFIAPQQDCDGPEPETCHWSAGPVPAHHIFVLGDNRGDSADSAYHLCVNKQITCRPGDEYVDTSLVVGKVFARVWPADRFHFLQRPAGFDTVPDAARAGGS